MSIRSKGIVFFEILPPLLKKLYIKNLERQSKSVSMTMFELKFYSMVGFINHLRWDNTQEGHRFWDLVSNGMTKEALKILKENKS